MDINESVENVKKVVDTFGEIIHLFTETFDQILPWKVFDRKLKELDQSHIEFAQETKDILSFIKTHMTEGLDAYSSSAKTVYDWSKSVLPLLTTYNLLFKKDNADILNAQNTLFAALLNEGYSSIKETESNINKCFANFNQVQDNLQTFSKQLEIEFDFHGNYANRKYEQFMKKLKYDSAAKPFFIATISNNAAINKFNSDIEAELESIKKPFAELKDMLTKTIIEFDQTKSSIEYEIRIIKRSLDDLPKIFADSDQSLKKLILSSVESLIKKCNEFNLLYKVRSELKI